VCDLARSYRREHDLSADGFDTGTRCGPRQACATSRGDRDASADAKARPVPGPAGVCDPAGSVTQCDAACPADASTAGAAPPLVSATWPTLAWRTYLPGRREGTTVPRLGRRLRPAQVCDGVNDACPADYQSEVPCLTPICDRPVCNGVNDACPADAARPSAAPPLVSATRPEFVTA
jgi:hypothetical protein